jgi:hypothetical protein
MLAILSDRYSIVGARHCRAPTTAKSLRRIDFAACINNPVPTSNKNSD